MNGETTLTLTEIFLLVASISVTVITIFLIPLLIQLKRTTKRAENLMEKVEGDLPELLNSMNNTASELNSISKSLNRKLAEVEFILDTARMTVESLFMTSNLFRKTLSPVLTGVGGLGSGLGAFLAFLLRSKPKKGKEAETHE